MELFHLFITAKNVHEFLKIFQRLIGYGMDPRDNFIKSISVLTNQQMGSIIADSHDLMNVYERDIQDLKKEKEEIKKEHELDLARLEMMNNLYNNLILTMSNKI